MIIRKHADIVIDLENIPDYVLRQLERKLNAVIKLDDHFNKYLVQIETHY